jgi:serine/threonine protein kinase
MDYNEHWQIIDGLGEGGQGKVFRVNDKLEFAMDDQFYETFENAIKGVTSVQYREDKRKYIDSFRGIISKISQAENPTNHGALKILHEPQDARDSERAQERIKSEIEAMRGISHPNLLKILDADPDAQWFVSEFHLKGSLGKTENKEIFIGDFVKSLQALRPLVEGIAKFHGEGFVHRDIKPQNIFIGSNENLVLGDFGLVAIEGSQHTRISGTWENVGSRDWMPGWAQGMRIEELKSTFDVFSLGKLLWAMISDIPILRLWYFDRDEFNLEVKFPETPYINLANSLFKKCIVEDEENCLPDANSLLEEIDKILSIIGIGADLIGDGIKRKCKVCGIGTYQLVADKDLDKIKNIGLNPYSGDTLKIFTCAHCGHVQFFHFKENNGPPAWNQ